MATKTASTALPSTIDRLQQVKNRTGLSRTSIYRLMNDGKFPASLKLGERAIGWRSSDIDAWIESRTSAAGV